MTASIDRRTALFGSLLTASTFASFSALTQPSHAQNTAIQTAKARLADLDRKHGGRLGVAILNIATGNQVEHRGHERFALCSTFKLLTAAFVLARTDRNEEQLDRRIVFAKSDLVTWSPVTEKRVGQPGMTLEELCEAAITQSDNTAANCLLASFGGPAGLTAFLRSIGDDVTRLDRIELELNEATPGDPRDTTTPAAMLNSMRKILVGDGLSAPSRERLIAWLIANKTGATRLRAGLPHEWRVGDKTGSGGYNSTNDVAIVWPPNKDPLLITAYYTESKGTGDQRNAILAEVGKIAMMV